MVHQEGQGAYDCSILAASEKGQSEKGQVRKAQPTSPSPGEGEGEGEVMIPFAPFPIGLFQVVMS